MGGGTIAVAICTMNRPAELQRALDALGKCSPPPDEILVSDDSPESDRRSAEVCGRFSSVRYQRGPRNGLSVNRNSCIASCNATWIHFIDDDVVVPETFYRDAAKWIAAEGSEWITGLEDNYACSDPRPTRIEPPRLTFWGVLAPARGKPLGCTVINATLFRRSLFDGILFDPAFRYGCEEIDVTQALLANGHKLLVAPDLVVSHYPSAANRSTYAGQQITSRVYFGLKCQWRYRRSAVGTLAFAALGVPRIILHSLRHDGARGLVASIRQSFAGTAHFIRSLST